MPPTGWWKGRQSPGCILVPVAGGVPAGLDL